MSDAERAVSYFDEGYSYSQAILAVYSQRFGLGSETALRIAAGFSGGMRIGETCGAVTGAIMVLGLKHASSDTANKQAKAKTYKAVTELISKFRSRNGSVVCKELLNCDVSTPAGIKTAGENNIFASVCPKMVRHAGEILEEMLNADA